MGFISKRFQVARVTVILGIDAQGAVADGRRDLLGAHGDLMGFDALLENRYLTATTH